MICLVTNMRKLVEWLESHMLPCIYNKYLGLQCPGCGMQRSFIELLKGNFWESFLLYPPLVPLWSMVAYLIFHLIFKFENGALVLKVWFIFNAILIIVNYTLKLVYL